MAEIQTVVEQLNVPKESKEIIDAVLGILEDAIAKKPMADILAGALPRVISAVDGLNKVGSEFAGKKGDLIAYLVHKALIALKV